MTTAYLAGPDVFRPNWKEYFERLKAACRKYGVEGRSPLDNEVITSGAKWLVAADIRRKNVTLIERCDIVLANVSPFRGPNADDGTAFEVGYATARRKPVLCYAGYSDRPLIDKIQGQLWAWDDVPMVNVERGKDINGWAVEDFDLPVNLMLVNPEWGGVHPSVEAALEFWSSRKGIV